MHLHQDPRFNQWYRHVRGRPSWVWTITLGSAALIVAVPLLLLTLAALIVAAVVFTMLSLLAAGLRLVTQLFSGDSLARPSQPHAAPGSDGRRNVRVVERP